MSWCRRPEAGKARAASPSCISFRCVSTRKTLRSIALRPGLPLGLFVSGAVLLLLARFHRVPAPVPDRLYAYDDHTTGGRSRVLEVRPVPGGWRLVFSLQPNAAGYCGLGLAFGNGDTAFRDLSRLRNLEFKLRNPASRTVKVIALAHDPKLTRPSIPLSYRFSEARLGTQPEGMQAVPARDFAIATWWLDQGFVPVSDTALRFDRLHALEFQVLGSGTSSRPDTLEILAPKLWLGNPLPWKTSLALWLAGLVSLGLLQRRRLTVPATAQPLVAAAPTENVPPPVPTTMRSESQLQRERLVEWLRAHYNDSELDADTVAKGCGIPRDRLATLLKEGYGMAFKPFLNELRLTEAARLLHETDRSISEIAFAVGYNSHTHFTRVFRERYRTTPGEWREAAPPEAPGSASNG